MSQPDTGSYDERLSVGEDEKQRLANAAAGHLKNTGYSGEVFIASGTTAATAGIAIMEKCSGAIFWTHSVPFMHSFIKGPPKNAARLVHVRGGRVEPITGCISHGRFDRRSDAIMIWGTHAISPYGLTSNRDSESLRFALDGCGTILLLPLVEKLCRNDGQEGVRVLGRMKGDIDAGRHQYHLIFDDAGLRHLAKQRATSFQRACRTLEKLAEIGVTIQDVEGNEWDNEKVKNLVHSHNHR